MQLPWGGGERGEMRHVHSIQGYQKKKKKKEINKSLDQAGQVDSVEAATPRQFAP